MNDYTLVQLWNSPPETWRACLNTMPKQILVIVLAFFAFVCIGCHHDEEGPKELLALPSLHITMTSLQLDSIIEDQDNKVSAYAILYNTDGDTLFKGNLTHIKTRGNSTYKEKKKPFAIKFPKKQSFFGLDRSKSFVLLANAYDESHVRNAIALDLARAMGIPAPRYAYLSLYINGVYKGLYQMTNKVDVGKNALDITNLDKLNEWVNPKPLDTYEWFGLGREKQVIQRKGVLLDNNPEDITGGYLLDITGPPEYYGKSLSGFVSAAKDNIRIRSPKYASMQEVDYIAERYNEMESAVMAADGCHPETGRYYTEYLDRESFVHYYLLNELLLNWDGGWASFMMYKDADTIDPRFYAGPAWDFDKTLDNPRFSDDAQTNLYCNEIFVDESWEGVGSAHSGGLLHCLCQYKDFQQAVRDCWLKELGPACHDYLAAHSFDSLAILLSHEADRDNELYENRHSKNYEASVNRAITFLRDRIAFFDWYYASTEEEQVMIIAEWISGKNRKFYYPLEEAIEVPCLEDVWYNHDPVYELYYAGTDSYVPNGTIFHSSQKLELRKREPTKREMQMRRIRKKLKKIGLHF